MTSSESKGLRFTILMEVSGFHSVVNVLRVVMTVDMMERGKKCLMEPNWSQLCRL